MAWAGQQDTIESVDPKSKPSRIVPFTHHQALELHIQAVHTEAQAKVCSAHLPPMAEPLRDALSRWRSANAAGLKQGAAVAAQQGMSESQTPSLAHMASLKAEVLGSLPLDDMQRRCSELLDMLSLPN